MRVDRKKGSAERRILIGMIVDEILLGRISSKWTDNMFRSKWANLVARWCLWYYNKYKKAPMKHIESLYEKWSEKAADKSAADLVAKFLSSLSEEYETLKEESNTDYLIDLAGNHFNQVVIERLLEKAQDEIDDGQVDTAHSLIISHNRIEMGMGKGINVFEDKEALKKAFESRKEPLVKYGGDLGKFFGDAFERGGFLSFMAPEKRGKSFWLADVAFRAVLQRRKVVLFEAGDMGEDSVIRRLAVRASQHPRKAGRVRIPTKIKFREDKPVRVKGGNVDFDEGLSWRKSWKAFEKVMKKAHHKSKRKDTRFKLSAHPNSTLSVKGIESILQEWEVEDWVPDIIIIDYADILNMNYPRLEGRDSINETWKQLRSLSQKHHCLVVTATQADSASYGKNTINMSNFSEDKRKLSHVTGMIGINWVVLREAPYLENRCVYVAGCLDVANPALVSAFRPRD
jgi:hypothetical protein